MTFLTSPGVDDEVGRGVDGEEEVGEGDHALDEAGDFAAGVGTIREEATVDHLVHVRDDLGRLKKTQFP